MLDWPWSRCKKVAKESREFLFFALISLLYRYEGFFIPLFIRFLPSSPKFSRYAVRLVCFSRRWSTERGFSQWIGDGSVIEGCHVPSIALPCLLFFHVRFLWRSIRKIFFLPRGAFHRVFINRNSCLKFIPVLFDSWFHRKIVLNGRSKWKICIIQFS